MARGGRDTRYDVTIGLKLDAKGIPVGAAQANSATDKMLREQMRAIESANRKQAADAKRTALEIAQIEAQQSRREIAERKNAVREFQRAEADKVRSAERSANQRTKAEQQAAREIARINQQTARQAEQQNRVRERAAKSLADEEQRQIKRTQDAFLRAEKDKTAAIHRTQAAHKASADSTSAAWLTAFGAIKVAALALATGVTAVVGGLGFAISRAMSFDVLERSLKVVAGTAEEAQRQMVRLKELARLPGLGLRQAIEASIALQIGFQTAIKDTGKRLELTESVIQQFSNAIALTGGGPDVFQRVITQLTQMSNAGKVLMTDLRPIIQSAPAIGQSLLKAFGTISPEEINALGLSTEEFMRRWVAALSTLERAPETAANAWTNFTTAFDLALVKIGKPFLEPLTRALTVLEPMLDSFGTHVSELFTMIGQDASKLWAGLPEATRAQFADMVATVQGMGGTIVQWFKDNYPLMQAVVVNVLQQIANFWKTYGEQIKLIAGHQLESLLSQVRAVLLLLSGDWRTAWAELPKIIMSEGKKMTQAVGFIFRLLINALLLQKDLLKKLGESIGAAIMDGIIAGMKRKASEVLKTAMLVFNPIPEIARRIFQTQSPSKVFFRIGQNVVDGFIQGVIDRRDALKKTTLELLEVAIAAFPDPDKPTEKLTAKQSAAAKAKAAWDAEKATMREIREELIHQRDVMRELGGEESSIARVNRLLSDPKIAERIDERTRALMKFHAAIEDARKTATRERFVNPQTRPRRVDEDLPLDETQIERARRASEGWEVDAALGTAYGEIIDELNGKLSANNDLTQTQITLQRLESQGLLDLNDVRTQEALRIAGVIDQMTELASTRERVRQIAEDVSSVFSRAVDNWSGSLGAFFKDIGRGFGDLLKRMVADVVQSKLVGVFEQLFSKIFGGGQAQGGGGGILGGIFGGGGSGGGVLGRIFGGGGATATPPFVGNFAGGGLFASLLPSLTAGGGSVPQSLTSGGLGGLSGLLHEAGHGGAAATGALATGSIKTGIGAILPLLGLSLGASAGGASRFGSILGGAGGLLAGGVGAAFLAPGLFATSGVFGSLGPAIAGLLTNPFTIAAAGALIVGAIILGKKAQRDKDEKTRAAAQQDTGTALFAILNAVRNDSMDGNTARSEIEKLHQNWIAVGNSLKDSKTRRIHMETWSHFQPIIDGIEKEIAQQTTRSNNRNRMVPVFTSGGTSATSQLIKVRPDEGIRYPGSNIVHRVEGRDLGYDSQFMYAPKGTRIINQSEMKQSPGFQHGGIVGDSGGSNTPNIAPRITATVEIDQDGMAKIVLRSPLFKDAVIHNVKVGRLEKKL